MRGSEDIATSDGRKKIIALFSRFHPLSSTLIMAEGTANKMNDENDSKTRTENNTSLLFFVIFRYDLKCCFF